MILYVWDKEIDLICKYHLDILLNTYPLQIYEHAWVKLSLVLSNVRLGGLLAEYFLLRCCVQCS